MHGDGFTIIEDVYKPEEIAAILNAIEKTPHAGPSFRKSKDLFAIRRFLFEIPGVNELIFNGNLKTVISRVFGEDFFVVKSIYFDKPAISNWFVAWHQDLTIAVNHKIDIAGYRHWTKKADWFAVQPPLDILTQNFTVRIHLDHADERSGALKVIKGSHLNILRMEEINLQTNEITCCPVSAGGIMLMRPLLMHASDRTASQKQRRVIHLEFSRVELPDGIEWAERIAY